MRRVRSNWKRGKSGAPVKALAQVGITSWRTASVKRFDTEVAEGLRDALANVTILGEPLWTAALAGDPRAAISLALRLTSERATGTAYDVAMTAVAACAAEGSEAACLVMSYVLDRKPGASRREARLATAWLARCSDGIRKRKETR